MLLNEHVTKKIKETTKQYFSDADVMLFGYRANETADDESDYDVLIITKQFISPEKKLFSELKSEKTC